MHGMPDLPEIMSYGKTLTEALTFWSEMMNSRNLNRDFWINRLRDECLAQNEGLSGPPASRVLQ